MEKSDKAFDERGKMDSMATYVKGNKLKLWGEAEIQGKSPDKISKLKLERIGQPSITVQEGLGGGEPNRSTPL